MEKKIWAATFIDGTRASAPGIVVSYLGIIDGRRIVELDYKSFEPDSKEEQEYTETLKHYAKNMMTIAQYKTKITEENTHVICSL